jgi:hypothetical protein
LAFKANALSNTNNTKAIYPIANPDKAAISTFIDGKSVYFDD